MARVPQYFNFGSLGERLDPDLSRLLSIMYSTLARAINGVTDPNEGVNFNSPQVYSDGSTPSASAQINENFQVGDIWIDTSASPDKVYFLTARSDADTVTWTAVN